MHHKMKTVRSQRHQLGSYEINKVSLSCFDDKRYIHDNGVSSYAYGHHKVEYMNDTNLLLKYRYPYCGEDIDLFHFTQISVSILWRRYDFLK